MRQGRGRRNKERKERKLRSRSGSKTGTQRGACTFVISNSDLNCRIFCFPFPGIVVAITTATEFGQNRGRQTTLPVHPG